MGTSRPFLAMDDADQCSDDTTGLVTSRGNRVEQNVRDLRIAIPNGQCRLPLAGISEGRVLRKCMKKPAKSGLKCK